MAITQKGIESMLTQWFPAFLIVIASTNSVLAQSGCTEKSTPRECYEAALELVGKTLATLQAKEKELDAKLASLSIPRGAVVAFSLKTGCPSGWTDYTEAMGRVVIGADT